MLSTVRTEIFWMYVPLAINVLFYLWCISAAKSCGSSAFCRTDYPPLLTLLSDSNWFYCYGLASNYFQSNPGLPLGSARVIFLPPPLGGEAVCYWVNAHTPILSNGAAQKATDHLTRFLWFIRLLWATERGKLWKYHPWACPGIQEVLENGI